MLVEEMSKLADELGEPDFNAESFDTAAQLFNEMVTGKELDEFLTLPAYEQLA